MNIDSLSGVLTKFPTDPTSGRVLAGDTSFLADRQVLQAVVSATGSSGTLLDFSGRQILILHPSLKAGEAVAVRAAGPPGTPVSEVILTRITGPTGGSAPEVSPAPGQDVLRMQPGLSRQPSFSTRFEIVSRLPLADLVDRSLQAITGSPPPAPPAAVGRSTPGQAQDGTASSTVLRANPGAAGDSPAGHTQNLASGAESGLRNQADPTTLNLAGPRGPVLADEAVKGPTSRSAVTAAPSGAGPRGNDAAAERAESIGNPARRGPSTGEYTGSSLNREVAPASKSPTPPEFPAHDAPATGSARSVRPPRLSEDRSPPIQLPPRDARSPSRVPAAVNPAAALPASGDSPASTQRPPAAPAKATGPIEGPKFSSVAVRQSTSNPGPGPVVPGTGPTAGSAGQAPDPPPAAAPATRGPESVPVTARDQPKVPPHGGNPPAGKPEGIAGPGSSRLPQRDPGAGKPIPDGPSSPAPDRSAYSDGRAVSPLSNVLSPESFFPANVGRAPDKSFLKAPPVPVGPADRLRGLPQPGTDRSSPSAAGNPGAASQGSLGRPEAVSARSSPPSDPKGVPAVGDLSFSAAGSKGSTLNQAPPLLSPSPSLVQPASPATFSGIRKPASSPGGPGQASASFSSRDAVPPTPAREAARASGVEVTRVAHEPAKVLLESEVPLPDEVWWFHQEAQAGAADRSPRPLLWYAVSSSASADAGTRPLVALSNPFETPQPAGQAHEAVVLLKSGPVLAVKVGDGIGLIPLRPEGREQLPLKQAATVEPAPEPAVVVAHRNGKSVVAGRFGVINLNPEIPTPPGSEILLTRRGADAVQARPMAPTDLLRDWARHEARPVPARVLGGREGLLYLDTELGAIRTRGPEVPSGRQILVQVHGEGPEIVLEPVSDPDRDLRLATEVAGRSAPPCPPWREHGAAWARALRWISFGAAASGDPELVENLRSLLPESRLAGGHAGVERLVRDSGAWYEARLAAAPSAEAMAAIARTDLKALLLRFAQPDSNAPGGTTVGVHAIEEQLEMMEGQQARILLAAHRSDAWVMDLPWTAGTAARMYFEEDRKTTPGSGKGGARRRILFLLDLQQAGRLRIDAAVTPESVNVGVIPGTRPFRDFLARQLGRLEAGLREAGYASVVVRILDQVDPVVERNFDDLEQGRIPGSAGDLDLRA